MAFGETWHDGETAADAADSLAHPYMREGDLATFRGVRGLRVLVRVTGAQAGTYQYGRTAPWTSGTVEVQITGPRDVYRWGYQIGERIRVTPLFLSPRARRHGGAR
jgi:hypothetical protein